MATILACVDGSRFSASVCDAAAWVATRIGAAVEAVHVLDQPHAAGRPADLSGAFEIDMRDNLLEELAALDEQRSKLAQRRGWLVLDEARNRLSAAGVSEVRVHQYQGAVVDTITERDGDVDLVVIGRRGESADVARPHLGSNLERVVRASRHPVLVVSEQFTPISRFILAFDGGPSATRAVEYLSTSRLLADAACHIVTVASGSGDRAAALDAAKATLTRAGYAVTSGVVTGHVEQAIIGEVGKQQADLLVMGAYGHSRIRELIIGSTTTVMLNRSPVPVLLFR